MPGDYRDRLREAEALVARARTPVERRAFEEIADVWRRLLAGETPIPKPDRPSDGAGS